MLVQDRMTSPAITVRPSCTFQDAMKLMQEKRIRRLPVVNDRGRLVGIVSQRDLLSTSPSPATSLSVWEMNYLLNQFTVKEIMTRQVFTLSADTPLEVAAAEMARRKIGGMPVTDDESRVVGVITNTDILQALAATLGNDEWGVRLTIDAYNYTGVLADLTQILLELDGEIVSMATFTDPETEKRQLVVKIQGAGMDELTEPLERLGDHVVDARAYAPQDAALVA